MYMLCANAMNFFSFFILSCFAHQSVFCSTLLWDIVSVSVSASEVAGEKIRTIFSSGKVAIAEKSGKHDVVTTADFEAQKTLVGALQTAFPHRTFEIRGEEGEIGYEETRTISSSALKAIKKSVLINPAFESLYGAIVERTITVWIDPLDATGSFAGVVRQKLDRSKLQEVTVLVGIAVGDKPVAGVIHQPFFREGVSRSLIGIVGVGAYEILSTGDVRQLDTLDGFPGILKKPKVAMTTPGPHEDTKAILSAIDGSTEVFARGAGFKALQIVADGKADMWVTAKPFTKKWDTCAPEAILKSLGGDLTDLHGNHYKYDANQADDKISVANYGGVIATGPGISGTEVIDAAKRKKIAKKLTKKAYANILQSQQQKKKPV